MPSRAFALFAAATPGLVAGAAAPAADLEGATPTVFGIVTPGPPTLELAAGAATLPPFGTTLLLGPPTEGADFGAAAPPTMEPGLGALPVDVPFVPAEAPNETSASTIAMAIVFDMLCLPEVRGRTSSMEYASNSGGSEASPGSGEGQSALVLPFLALQSGQSGYGQLAEPAEAPCCDWAE